MIANEFKYLMSKFFLKIQIPAIKDSKVDPTAKVCSKSHMYNSKLGAYSYVGNSCNVFFADIGKFCSIAEGCFIGGAQHPIEYVSTSPIFHIGKNIMNTNFAFHDDAQTKITKIGNDVWIGAHVLVKDGVKIGDGAIIGMGSVVTKDVEPYSVVAGVPAKVIKYRFTSDIIKKLLKIKWWNWDTDKIKKYAKYFNNTDNFVDILETDELRNI